MLIEGTKTLAAGRDTVWNALNDPAFLRATLPDCKSLSVQDDGGYAAVLTSGIGPVQASFNVNFRREVETPMQRYRLIGTGDGGLAGSARGDIRIELSDIEGGTQLAYACETVINGKIAQLGSRMIDGAARKFSERFFQNVQRRLAPETAGGASAQTRGDDSPTRTMPGALPAGIASWWLPAACALGCFAGTFLANYLSR
jgi:uncharacterized protein